MGLCALNRINRDGIPENFVYLLSRALIHVGAESWLFTQYGLVGMCYPIGILLYTLYVDWLVAGIHFSWLALISLVAWWVPGLHLVSATLLGAGILIEIFVENRRRLRQRRRQERRTWIVEISIWFYLLVFGMFWMACDMSNRLFDHREDLSMTISKRVAMENER